MIDKLEQIATAWIDSYNPSEEQQKIANHRLSICKDKNKCNSLKYNDVLDFFYCGECSCPIMKKIYAKKKETSDEPLCPLNKWDV
jgi:hypothetical protein